MRLIEQAGGKYIGLQDDGNGGKLIAFNEPKTGSTIYTKMDSTPEQIKKMLADKVKQFKHPLDKFLDGEK